MATTYRVEAHDGKRWSFGIRMNDDRRVPEFCGISTADHFNTRDEAFRLRDHASRLAGGTLRVVSISDDA